ncbi:inorganic phosphate transporter [Defluviitalea raffinosedens]|uniref:Inorganic phosphate transporter n=1 Tax=Defluviitalea raffinosedens TaxID=1450156 RepID=A0A7C8LGQ6_9FIRM|nr:inorganic phosphate transporter [Defluviitalea raffinosedens]KAE9634041.1 inorganic phosphate transporter [Defluviitalea raffinosedens]
MIIMISPSVISGAILGWALGSNGAANCFAAAVSTRIVKYRTAIILTAVFVILGACLEGSKGVHKISDYSYNSGINTPMKAFLVMLAAAITITLMTVIHLPVSTSQAVIGAIIGGALLEGKADFSELFKFFYAWFLTPFGAIIIAFILYKSFELFIEKRIKDYVIYDQIIKAGYYISGIFSAYSLGGNNVANVTSVYAGKINLLTTKQAVFIGGLTIALGVLTYSKGVMKTVGESLVTLSPVSGLISVFTGAIVVYIYTQIGIPVSASHAIVGAVIGIGLVKGVNTISIKAIRNILFGWFGTPAISGVISLLFFYLFST